MRSGSGGARTVAVAAAVTVVLALAIRSGLAVLVLALALVVPAGLALLDRPQRGVLALVALVPFSGLLLLVGGPGWLAGWKEALILATLGATFVAPEAARRSAPVERPSWVIGAGLLLGIAVVSAVVIAEPRVVAGLKIGFFYLLVPVILWRCPLSRTERDRVVTILLGAGLATALYGLLQQALGPDLMNAWGYEYNDTIRFTGGWMRSWSSFDEPFPFALFLMVVLLVALPHALEQPGRLRSRVLWLTSPVFAAALATTFVRAAWLGLAVGVLLLALRRYPVLLLPLPFALVGLLFLPASVSSAALSSESSGERLATWDENIDRVAQQPLGFGIGASGSAANRAADAGAEGPLLLLPDNHYFKVLYDLGVLGLWVFVLLLLAVRSSVALELARADGADELFVLGVHAVVAACAAAAVMANLFEIFPIDVLFWTLVGIVTLPEPASRPVRPPAPALAAGRAS